MFKFWVIFLVSLAAVGPGQINGQAVRFFGGCYEDRNCDSGCGKNEYGVCLGDYADRGKGEGKCACNRKSECVFDRECKAKLTCKQGLNAVCSGGLGATCSCRNTCKSNHDCASKKCNPIANEKTTPSCKLNHYYTCACVRSGHGTECKAAKDCKCESFELEGVSCDSGFCSCGMTECDSDEPGQTCSVLKCKNGSPAFCAADDRCRCNEQCDEVTDLKSADSYSGECKNKIYCQSKMRPICMDDKDHGRVCRCTPAWPENYGQG